MNHQFIAVDSYSLKKTKQAATPSMASKPPLQSAIPPPPLIQPTLPPPPSQFANTTTDSANDIDADQLIEALMKEAEQDPGLRELSGLNKSRKPPVMPEKYPPMVKRPYRTQQDMIIREKSDSEDESGMSNSNSFRFSRPQQPQPARNRAPERSYRPIVVEDARMERQALPKPSSRSKSADTSGAKRVDRRLDSFQRTASTENFTEEIMHEVVTDQEHKSVKNLVAMIEKNTKSESANPYVRKWGCDLISPEPHTRNVTYRRERKDFSASRPRQAYNWTQDDHFKQRHRVNGEEVGGVVRFSNEDEGHLENDFRLSAHVSDMDDLLGRPLPTAATDPNYATYSESEEYTPATHVWPPPDHQQVMTADRPPHPQATQPGKRHISDNKVAAGMAENEIDSHIASIQSDFETELDAMIDNYRDTRSKVTKKNYTKSMKLI